ncbi:unnamed protein product [Cylicocyclus nassatus]|uniref:MARVEL domain-containing protein n=1 Tax=Cylicocyclus nassatus TaxID=53992 RepID=A0AA36M7K1_CYLNA|nr:unnamed protein product [Cylicocyclus nassatus]
MATLNLSTFKYPLGFIRIVEFLFIIIAIASVNSWKVGLDYDCPDGTKHRASVATFSLSQAVIEDCKNSTSTLWGSDDSASGSAGFFYFVNVAALIYVLIITFIYVVFWPVYESEKRLALVDLALTALLFVLFFFCSATWWAGSNTLGYATGEERVTQLMKENPSFWKNSTTNDLHLMRDTSNGKLTISVLCDWVCVFTFAMNCWFIWKEVVPRPQTNPSQVA